MHKLELSYSQLHTLKNVIVSDIEYSAMDVPDFTDAEDMFFYYERAKILDAINEELATGFEQMGEPT